MITMNELVDLRMQQHIAHEIYRQQIMQRIPDPFPPLLPIPMPRHVIMPPRVTLPGVEVTLQNDELWKQFHQIGTEMIITKSGRRMFPSMRLSLAGLEEETNYCVLLEMVPIGDCRYKFSGSQWVPAGGAEPQSPQRMYLHPDSPASGSHWQAQPILFNKVKLTNNTLDSSGHIVLASMHKYQPRIYVIRTSDLTQIPWAPQQAFVFPETEFVAVTAYQNDRITKLKIDHNPFAKGFRETGQSRCKRKMSSSPSDDDQEQPHAQQQKQQQKQQQRSTHQPQPQCQSQSHSHHQHQHQSPNDMSPTKSALTTTSDSGSSICSDKPALHSSDDIVGDVDVDSIADGPQIKRMRSNGSACSITSALDEAHATGHSGVGAGVGFLLASGETSLPNATHEWQATLLAAGQLPLPPPLAPPTTATRPSGSFASSDAGASFMQHFQQNMQTLLRPSLVDLACTYFGRPQPIYAQHVYAQQQQQQQQQQQHAALPAATQPVGDSAIGTLQLQEQLQLPLTELPNSVSDINTNKAANALATAARASKVLADAAAAIEPAVTLQQEDLDPLQQSPPTKKKGFSISAILGGGS